MRSSPSLPICGWGPAPLARTILRWSCSPPRCIVSGRRGIKHISTRPDEREKDFFLSEYPDLWEFEGIGYGGHIDNFDPDVASVHRFWSETLGVYFYTINQKEAEKLQSEYSDVWAYEGIVFYAYPEKRAPVGTMPVYRFWSESLASHFYTISEDEKDKLMSEYAEVWSYEGIAWFAYLP